MARISILKCLLLLVCITRLKAFSFHKTVNEVVKPSEDSNYSIGPEFLEEGKFAYVKVKVINHTPPAIHVELLIYDKSSPVVSQSFKRFVADRASMSIIVTSIKAKGRGPILLTISERQKSGEDKTSLIKWEPFAYPDPNLHLPVNHTIVSRGWHFEVFMNDNATCHSLNGMCRIEFQDKQKPVIYGFLNRDLIWSNMHIDYTKDGQGILISGFDAAGNYKFLVSRSLGLPDELFSLPDASKSLKVYSLSNGFCFVGKPGIDRSMTCLRYDSQRRGEVNLRTITYDESISLLQVRETDSAETLFVAKRNPCDGMDCFDISVKKVPVNVEKPISHHELALECSNDEKLFNVDIKKGGGYSNTLIIEYICETRHRFIFKSVTINDS